MPIPLIVKEGVMSRFSDNLKLIKEELTVNKGFSREEFFENCINTKLNNVVHCYNELIDDSSEFLLTRNLEQVLKEITKIQKVKDREVLKGYLKNKKSE